MTTPPSLIESTDTTLDLAPAPATTTPVHAPARAPELDLTPAVGLAPAPTAPPVSPSIAPGPGQRPATPAEAYAALLQGNARFMADAPHYPNHHTSRRAALTAGQAPFSIVFSCADSRVPPELVFDRGLGDLFVVRTAGHVIGPTTIGTIDYGVEHLGVPLLTVLGHAACGAVTATLGAHTSGEGPGGNIQELVDRVLPSVRTATGRGQASLDECIVEHVNTTVRDLPRVSPAIAERLENGTLGIVGMVYHLDSGRAEVVSHLGDFGA